MRKLTLIVILAIGYVQVLYLYLFNPKLESSFVGEGGNLKIDLYSNYQNSVTECIPLVGLFLTNKEYKLIVTYNGEANRVSVGDIDDSYYDICGAMRGGVFSRRGNTMYLFLPSMVPLRFLAIDLSSFTGEVRQGKPPGGDQILVRENI